MESRRRMTTTRRSIEVLEGRVVLTAAAHPLHALGAAHAEVARLHATAQKATAAANPVLVDLTPGTKGITITSVTYDQRLHLISVSGTVSVTASNATAGGYYPYVPSYPTTQFIGVTANQAVNRLQSVGGAQYSSLPVADASVTTLPFVERIVAYSGQFAKGTVNLTVNSSSGYGAYSTLNVIARLRPAKAY